MGSAGLYLERKGFWSEQVALRGRRVAFAADISELQLESIAVQIAIQQFLVLERDE